jgi:hypothetical protein
MPFLVKLYPFLPVRKKYWLLPGTLMVALFGSLIALAQGLPGPPFLYAC